MEAGKGSRSERQARRHRQHRGSPETATESSEDPTSGHIVASLRSGNLNEALRLLHCRHQAGKTLDLKTYSMIIKACGTSKRLREARTVFEMMKADGTRPDRVAYTSLIGMSRGQQALDLFDEMVADGFQPDAIAYTSLLNSSAGKGSWAQALSILDGMKDQRVDMNKAHITTVLKHFKEPDSCSKWALALQLFSSMPDHEIQPDPSCCNAMIHVLKAARQWEKALEIFAEMRSSRECAPNLISCSLMASCYRQTGDWPKAIELLGTARQQGIHLDTRVYQDLMYTAMKSQRWAEAIEMFESFQETGLKAKPSLHCLALEAAQRKTDWKKALSLLADLQENNWPLKDHAVEWAAAALAEGAAWEQATELFNTRQQLRTRLSQTSCESILGAHQSAGKWQESLELLEKMENEGLMTPRGHMQPPVRQRTGMQMGKSFQMTDIEPARHIWNPSGHTYQFQPMPRMAPAAAITPQAEASNWQLPQYQVVPHEVPRRPQAADANYHVYSYMREASQQVEESPQGGRGRTWHHPQHMHQAQGVPHSPQAWGNHQLPQCILVAAPQAYWANYQYVHLMPAAAQGVEYSNQARDGTHSHMPSGSTSRKNDTEANSASASK